MSNPKLDAFFEKMDAQGLMVTFDDVRMHTNESAVLPPDIVLDSRFSRRTPLKIPAISSAMSTVTEWPMAVKMATLGGLGVIHKNMDPEQQAKMVNRVKLYLNDSGRVDVPRTVLPDMTLAEVEVMRTEKRFDFKTFPVVNKEGVVVGMLSGSDFRFASDLSVTVGEAMTELKDGSGFLYGDKKTTPEKAFAQMRKAKKNVMPLLQEGKIVGMYVFSDLQRNFSGKSLNNVDSNGHLVAAAAVGAGDSALVRAELLAVARCNVFHIDTAHGDSKNVFNTISLLKRYYPEIDVVAGNVSRGESASRLVDAGADGILVGQGPGSICTTRIVAGVGCPQISAIYNCAKAVEGSGVPVCADGGIKHPGDVAIAIAAGAHSVMMGGVLAATDASPGLLIQEKGQQMKEYYGMGSRRAMSEREESRQRYGYGDVSTDSALPEGIEGKVPYKGLLENVLQQYIGGLRAGAAYVGAKTLPEFQQRAELFRVTNAGLTESHPHDIQR